MPHSANRQVEDTAAARLRGFLAASELPFDGRLPAERELSQTLGVSRAALRKALGELESEGQIWRHVGKGTFIGSRPIDGSNDIVSMARRTSPAEVMGARLAFEPEITRLAARNATPVHLAEMRNCLARAKQATTWRQYESWDNRLHRTIGEAARNGLLLALLDTLNAVRRTVTWGRLRTNPVRPGLDHHSFAEHEAIVAAIEERDLNRAAAAMRTHLQSVERNLLGEQPPPDPPRPRP